jgi:hypothetical protein
MSVQKEIATAADETPALPEELARLKELVETSRIDEARALVKQMEARWPGCSERVRRFAKVLALPVARVAPGAYRKTPEQVDAENRWMEENRGKYPGNWVVIFGDQVIAVGPDLRAVNEKARAALGDRIGLLLFHPTESDTRGANL